MVGRQDTRRRRLRAAAPAFLAGALLMLAPAPIVHAAPPSNDDRAGATAIAIFESGPFDLAEATVASDDPGPCAGGAPVQGSVWFAYTAAETGPVLVTFAGAAGVSLHVLDADGSTEVGCSVTADPGYLEPHVDLLASAGETYLIELAGRIDDDSTGYLFIERPLVVSLDPVTSGHVTASGAVVVSYVFTCSQDLVLEPELDLTQGSGASLAMGSTLETHNCFAPGTTITMTVVPGNGPNPAARFRAGSADAFIQFNALTFAQSYRSLAETRSIQLTGGPVVTAPPTDAAAATPTGKAPDDAPGVLWLLGPAAGLALLGFLGWPGFRRPRSRRA